MKQARTAWVSTMKRREFITLLGGAAAAWPLAARAQQPGRVWRIGVLETTSMELNAASFEAFRQSLRDLGYVEEQNLIIEYRSAEGRGERFANCVIKLRFFCVRASTLTMSASTCCEVASANAGAMSSTFRTSSSCGVSPSFLAAVCSSFQSGGTTGLPML